jgi:hypothetical protein
MKTSLSEKKPLPACHTDTESFNPEPGTDANSGGTMACLAKLRLRWLRVKRIGWSEVRKMMLRN